MEDLAYGGYSFDSLSVQLNWCNAESVAKKGAWLEVGWVKLSEANRGCGYLWQHQRLEITEGLL